MARPGLTVLQMLPALEGGGVEQGTVDITAALSAAGHEALVMSRGGRMVQAVEAAGGEHLCWPVGAKSPLSLRLVPRLRRLFVQRSVSIVHPRSRVPAWLAWLAWRGMPAAHRPRLVTTVHGFYRPGRYSGVMVRGERVICVSESIHRYVREHYPWVDPARLAVIHRGIDPERFSHGYQPPPAWQRAWAEAYPQLRRRRLLLLPARLTRRKGHEDFLHLIATLWRSGVDAHGLVAGGADPRRAAYAREMHALSRELGLDERVTFLGHRDDLREIMAASDLVLSLSTQPESFGRVVLEALSLGRPTLGYDHGGVAEILAALYPAGAVPPCDRDALARTAADMLRDPPPVAPSREFTLERMQARTLSLYTQLAHAPHQQP